MYFCIHRKQNKHLGLVSELAFVALNNENASTKQSNWLIFEVSAAIMPHDGVYISNGVSGQRQHPRNRRVQFKMAPKVHKDDKFSKRNSGKLSKKASSA